MDIDELEEFRGTERFVVERRLGAGGFGVVYRALDRKRNAVVALKTLSRRGSDALYRFKQEFRSLADIAHPNLITLYELLSEAGQWFFTMELVEGVDFLEHVGVRYCESAPSEGRAPSWGATPPAKRPTDAAKLTRMDLAAESTADPTKLWPALRQLGEGLHALHAAGKLHRDIKPSNVLVTGDGRVVLLDFGLVSDLSGEGVLQSLNLTGTPAYMSPEQAAGRPVSAASDWYGVGVMLYEALTGTRPFTGQYLDVLVQKQGGEPSAPRALLPSISAELDLLCRGLLRKDPRDRPGEDEILAFLRASTRGSNQPRSREAGRPAPFVGRAEHLEALDAAFARTRDGRAIVVLVEGSSGVGKSALVRRFLDDLRRRHRGVVVLSGRCFEQETVPYKALDSLVDALSQYLKRLPKAEVEALLPHDLLPLSRVFPVLRQVEAVAAARRRVVAIPDSQELRRRAFGALRELLTRLADRVPLVLSIDDLQWGDADSAALLLELFRPPDPPELLLVACCRSEDAEKSPLVGALRALRATAAAGPELRDLQIGDLTPEEARELARALLIGSGRRSDASAESVARESRGNPLFIDELARHIRSSGADEGSNDVLMPGAVRLEDVIWERVARLPKDAQRLLSTVAVAGRPLDRAVARRAAELFDDDQPAVAVLRAGHLLRGAAAEAEDHIEIYHDRIRETILARLSASEKEASHGRLALAFEASVSPDSEALAVHYQAAGASERAAVYAADAAAKAAEALAFDRAARLYKQALELGMADEDEAQRLRVRLGDALANAGRGAEAAQAYLAAAEPAAAAEKLDLHRRAAEQLLRSGHVDEGLEVTRRVLNRVGMRLAPTPWQAVLSLLLRRLQLKLRGLGFQRRSAGEIHPDDLIRVDTCWSVSAGLSMVDTVRARDFQTRHLLLALKAGEPYRVARALGVEAAFSGLGGERDRARTAWLVERAMETARTVNNPHAIAMAHLGAGMSAQLQGRWGAAWETAQRCEKVLREQCTGVSWELDAVHIYSLRSLFYLGRLGEVASRLPKLLQEAEERDDLYAEISLKTRHAYLVHLMLDEPAEARQQLTLAASEWSHQGFYLQHYFHLIGDLEIAMYAGSSREAWTTLAERWRVLQRSLLLRGAQYLRLEALHARGRCAIASAGSHGVPVSDRDALLGLATRDIRRIEKENAPWSNPLALLLSAGVASLRAQKEMVLDRLALAHAGFEQADMVLYTAAARRCRGILVGGEEGASLVAEADAWMTNEGIRNPERMTAMLAPGRWA
jgi:hypothetical protein